VVKQSQEKIMKFMFHSSGGNGVVRRLLAVAITFLMTIACPGGVASDTKDSLNVMSFNIRYNNPKDGANAWPNRKQNVAALIQFHQADLVGLQEALPEQISDLEKLLPEFRWFGVGRDNGTNQGEHTAIVYRTDKFELLQQGTLWCSPTPQIPSKGWDAMFNRTVTWGRFRLRRDGSEMLMLNTHFDHKGAEAREQCANIIRQTVDKLVGDTFMPVVITGDFNSRPDSKPYMTMVDGKRYKTALDDAANVSRSGRYGPTGTATGFKITAVRKQPIDYVFVNDKVVVNRFGVLSDSFDGRLPSDHYPVMVDINLKNKNITTSRIWHQ
jgi:endonuclease/exonuclease/phosphatase family metal-dependent hydrolase